MQYSVKVFENVCKENFYALMIFAIILPKVIPRNIYQWLLAKYYGKADS